MRIHFCGGPLDGAILETPLLPCGPIGIEAWPDSTEDGKIVVGGKCGVYWYDWSAIEGEDGELIASLGVTCRTESG